MRAHHPHDVNKDDILPGTVNRTLVFVIEAMSPSDVENALTRRENGQTKVLALD